jgi:hypothetical protein
MALGVQNHGIGTPVPCRWPRLSLFICKLRCGYPGPGGQSVDDSATGFTEWEGASTLCVNTQCRFEMPDALEAWVAACPYRSGTSGRPCPRRDIDVSAICFPRLCIHTVNDDLNHITQVVAAPVALGAVQSHEWSSVGPLYWSYDLAY